MKFSIKDLYDQTLRIWSHLLNKSLMESLLKEAPRQLT